MANMRMTVFDVERGLCVYVQTPTGYGMMIDCGCSASFSPAAWIAKTQTLTKYRNCALAKLVVTHPHDDHVEDIASVKTVLPPGILHRVRDFDWQAIVNPPEKDPSENVVAFYEWQKTYNTTIDVWPQWGIDIHHFNLAPSVAKSVSATNQNLVNNASIVTVLTYTVPTGGAWKVVIAGDNETAGWEELLKDPAFKSAIKGADFFVTSHHGHESGFSEDLFAAMGKPIFNITSEKAGDESVFDYSPYAAGRTIDNKPRYHLTTRNDGHITLWLNDDLTFKLDKTK